MQNPFSAPSNQNQRPLSGKLAENIMHFARVLREAGIPVGPGAVLDALDAAMSGSLRTRDDFYWTLHAVFVKRRDQREVFDQAFHVFWKKPKMLEQLMQMFFHQVARDVGEKAKQAGFRRLAAGSRLGPMTASSEPVSAAPTTWEYVTVPLITHATKQILDQWGADGWELVQVVPGPSGTDNLIAYLKRPRS